MRHVVSAFLFPCLAMAACLRAEAVYTFGDGILGTTANLTLQVGETASVPLYLYFTGNEYTYASSATPFSLMLVAVATSDPIPNPLPARLTGVQLNPRLGTVPEPGVEPGYTLIFYGEDEEDFGIGGVEVVMEDSLSRVLVATLAFEATAAGLVTFQTELWDASPLVRFCNTQFADIPDSAYLTINVLPTAVPLPAACWGGLALLGVTVAARCRSALRR